MDHIIRDLSFIIPYLYGTVHFPSQLYMERCDNQGYRVGVPSNFLHIIFGSVILALIITNILLDSRVPVQMMNDYRGCSVGVPSAPLHSR